MRVIPNLNDNDLIIKTPKQDRRYEKTNYSAKVSNKSQRASDALLSNVKLNGKQLNRVDEARRNGKQNRRGGSDRQTAHDETGNGRDGNAGRTMRDKTGDKKDGAEMLGDGRTTRRGKGRCERKHRTSSAQRNVKTGNNGRETSRQGEAGM